MNRYREARIRAGLSQKAAAISLGVKPPSMSDWERGKTQPKHDHLVAMAALYNTTTDYLTGVTDAKEKQPAAKNSELLNDLYQKINGLPLSSLYLLRGYLDGLKASQHTGSASPADPAEAPKPAQ